MKPNLAELVARWQEILRLRDWQLDVRYVPNLAAPDGSPAYGLCMPFVDAKRATIQIRDPETPARGAKPQDVEDTLVHELLHLHFAPLADNSGPGIAAEEQAVWAITEAFASVKDAGSQARLARAVVGAAQRTPPRRGDRKQGMDPILLAALKAALTSEDPKAAIEAILSQLEGGGEAPPPAEQGAGDDQQPPPRANRQAPTQAPARRAVPAAPPATPTALTAPPAPERRAVVPASGIVSRREFDRFRVERLLDRRPDLTEAQRAFGVELPFETAERWLKTLPAPTDANGNTAAAGATPPAGQGPTRAARPTAPTPGAVRATSEDDVLTRIDRRMGIAPPPEATVSRDPRTGRLTISSLQPVRLKKAGE